MPCWHLRHDRGPLVDLAGSALLAAFLVLVTPRIPIEHGDRTLDALGYSLLVGAAASLSIVRWRPRITVAVLAAILATYIVGDYPGGPIFVTGWIALFALGYRERRANAFVGAAALSGVLVLAGALSGHSEGLLHLVVVGWSAAAVFLGDAVRTRREQIAGAADRAVAEERLRIAQDLHDSVAHAMATINVQAGAAAHVIERRPEAAREALTAIQRASGEVLDELAALLNVLRDPEAPADRSPTPGLDDLPRLVASTTSAGLTVDLDVTGTLEGVSTPVSTAAYRIVQESLTNVVRHAGATTAKVRVTRSLAGLDVEVVDRGPGVDGAISNGTGRGIQGMRERAEATGGRLEAGPGPDGGFRVRAMWPGST
jgi:signal transduction histidine kinase